MDVNDLRAAVTVAGFLLFIVLMVHTWSKRRQSEHHDAAMLPFMDEVPPAADAGTPIPAKQGGLRE